MDGNFRAAHTGRSITGKAEPPRRVTRVGCVHRPGPPCRRGDIRSQFLGTKGVFNKIFVFRFLLRRAVQILTPTFEFQVFSIAWPRLSTVKCFHTKNVIISLLYFLKTKIIFKILFERSRQETGKNLFNHVRWSCPF